MRASRDAQNVFLKQVFWENRGHETRNESVFVHGATQDIVSLRKGITYRERNLQNLMFEFGELYEHVTQYK